MIPNLDFINTALNGVTALVEKAVKSMEAKIVTPDFEAKEDEDGYIKNKPPVRSGTGEGSVAFGEGIATGKRAFAHGRDGAHSYGIRATGSDSHAEGIETSASGDASHAEGKSANAIGRCSHAEGRDTVAVGEYSHAEGSMSQARGSDSHAEGDGACAEGAGSHAEGTRTLAQGIGSHAEGDGTTAGGDYSHAEGLHTIAQSDYQHVQGKYNIADAENKYAVIVGNGGTSNNDGYVINQSNAYTLDWEGNAWYAGSIEGTALILKSSTEGSTKRFKITVNDSGTLSATEITT